MIFPALGAWKSFGFNDLMPIQVDFRSGLSFERNTVPIFKAWQGGKAGFQWTLAKHVIQTKTASASWQSSVAPADIDPWFRAVGRTFLSATTM